jgi:Xaa-Pro dipeptidase
MGMMRTVVATSIVLACTAPTEQPAEGRIEQLATELREGDPWPAIRDERIRALLPGAMDAAGVDAWVVFCRENANEPLAIHVGGEAAGDDAAYLFFRTETGVERVILASSSEVITIRERAPDSRVESRERGESVFVAVAEELRATGSRSIAINRSDLAAADGLTATQDAELRAALGTSLASRLTSSQELVIRWLGVKIPAELAIMRKAAEITDLIEREAFLTVVPSQTTNGELHQTIRDRIEGLGLDHSWRGNPGITTGLDRGRGSDLARLIKPGDLINIDAGVTVFGTWHTDLQRFAYVLRPGETEPPEEISRSWETAKLSSRKMLDAMRPGVMGWEVEKVQIDWQRERGSLRHWASTGHPVGYWAHDVGPSIGGYDTGDPPRGNQLRELEPGMMFGYDGNAVWPAEDDGVTGTKSITIEEMGLVTENGGEYMCEPQEELVLISAP